MMKPQNTGARNTRSLRHPRLLRCLCVMATLNLVGGVRASAQSWLTVATVPGSPRTVLIDPSSDPAQPSAFVGGAEMDGLAVVDVGGNGHALPGAGPSICNKLEYEPVTGVLYAVGSSGTTQMWAVHQSIDGGVLWTLADTYQVGTQTSRATGFASDGLGNVFVCGKADDAKGFAHWIVRRRNAAGTWSTVRDYSVRNKHSAASQMCVHNGVLFVVGRSADKWMIQRAGNLEGALTWDAPYSWSPKGWNSSGAVAVAAATGGDIYVYGVVGGDEFRPAQAVLQKSTNSGSTWMTVAAFAESSLSNRAGDMVFGPSGTLYLAGSSAFEGTYPNAGFKWCIRRYLPASSTWIADWPFGINADEGTSGASGLSVNEAGNVFATGFVRNPDGSYASAVQRLVEEGELP